MTLQAGRLDLSGVTKQFTTRDGVFTALAPVDLNIAAGEFVTIVGASGCGKSTLLRLVVGLETPSSGSIRLDDVPVTKPAPERAIVFQDHRLFPWLTALENVTLALLKSPLSPPARRARAFELLELVGLAGFAGAYPAQLSGGMAQRVAIARALVAQPRILLLDEPFGALDALTRAHLQRELQRIVKAEGITALLVTHDVEEAIFLGARIVVMQPNPGRISDIVPVNLPDGHNKADPAFIALREAILEKLGADHDPAAGRVAA